MLGHGYALTARPRHRPGHQRHQGAPGRRRRRRSSRAARRRSASATPGPGWVEQAAEEIWAQRAAGRRRVPAPAVDAAPRRRRSASAPSASRCCCGTARTGEPLGPLVSWQDQRTAATCAGSARPAHADAGPRRSAACRSTRCSRRRRPRWLLDAHDPDRGRAAAGELCLGTVDAWLLCRLGGEPRHRGRQRLPHPAARRRDRRAGTQRLLDLFGVPPAVLPAVVPSTGPVPAVRGLAPLPDGVPVARGAGRLARGAVRARRAGAPGTVKATYGTGSSVMALVDRGRRAAGLCRDRRLATGASPALAVEGNIRSTGAHPELAGRAVRHAPPRPLAGRGRRRRGRRAPRPRLRRAWRAVVGRPTRRRLLSGLTLGTRRGAARRRGAGVGRVPGRGRAGAVSGPPGRYVSSRRRRADQQRPADAVQAEITARVVAAPPSTTSRAWAWPTPPGSAGLEHAPTSRQSRRDGGRVPPERPGATERRTPGRRTRPSTAPARPGPRPAPATAPPGGRQPAVHGERSQTRIHRRPRAADPLPIAAATIAPRLAMTRSSTAPLRGAACRRPGRPRHVRRRELPGQGRSRPSRAAPSSCPSCARRSPPTQDAAGAEYGTRQGTSPYSFAVRARAWPEAKSGRLPVTSGPGTDGTRVRSRSARPCNGTALRDAAGYITFGQFVNQVEYADAGPPLNNDAAEAADRPRHRRARRARRSRSRWRVHPPLTPATVDDHPGDAS